MNNGNYIIGKNWMFNTIDFVAYKVIKDKKGNVIEFKPVFAVLLNDGITEFIRVENQENIPLGVIKKSVKLAKMAINGGSDKMG